MGDERPAGSVTPLVELPCGVRGIVLARAESSWRAGCFDAPLRGRWLDGDVGQRRAASQVVRACVGSFDERAGNGARATCSVRPC